MGQYESALKIKKAAPSLIARTRLLVDPEAPARALIQAFRIQSTALAELCQVAHAKSDP